MPGGIHQFQVKKDLIQQGEQMGAALPGVEAAGFHGGMVAEPGAAQEHGLQEIGLQQGFSAGEGDPAARLPVKGFIFPEFPQKFLRADRIPLAGLPGFRVGAPGAA